MTATSQSTHADSQFEIFTYAVNILQRNTQLAVHFTLAALTARKIFLEPF